MTSVPLNGRAYTDLLALQPGVVPTAYGSQTPGLNDRSPSGAPGASGGSGLNSGNQSVNAQRELANGFMVDGANVSEGKNNGAAVVPNLDSISEFRIITNNFDAEYGMFNHAQFENPNGLINSSLLARSPVLTSTHHADRREIPVLVPLQSCQGRPVVLAALLFSPSLFPSLSEGVKCRP